MNVEYSVFFDDMGQDSIMPCLKNLSGKYDECVHTKIREDLMSGFNCTVPWLEEPNVCSDRATSVKVVTRLCSLIISSFLPVAHSQVNDRFFSYPPSSIQVAFCPQYS